MTTNDTYAVRGKLLLGISLEPGTLVVENGRISSVSRGMQRDGDLPGNVIDAEIVSPGMIDLQVNGAFGVEAATTGSSYDLISRGFAERGVTAWLPTIVTNQAGFYPRVFDAWSEVNQSAGAVPLGLHLEGPFLSVEKKGAHSEELIRAATDELFETWLEQAMIRLVTLAPERDGGLARISRLVEAGILTSLGHTNASFDEFTAGVEAGAKMATHLFNAMSAMHHRAPGAMIATMVDDQVTAGLIADGVHSHPATLQLAFRAKGPERLCLVSDMMAACGLGEGTYTLGGRPVTVDATSARLEDGTLAGSILMMDEAVRNMTEWTDATPAEALHMATAVPARLLEDDTRGALSAGARADLTLWNDDLSVDQTIIAAKSS